MTDKHADTSVFYSLRLFRRLLAEDILNEKKRLTAGFAATLITAFLAVMTPHCIQLIIDNALPRKSPALLGQYAVALFLVLFLTTFFLYMELSFIARASENIFLGFKKKLVDSILRKHLSFFSRYQSSDLLTRMVMDLNLVSEFFYKYLLKSLVQFVLVAFYLVYIFILNWRLSLIALLGIPVLGIIMATLDRHITETSVLSRKRLSEQNDRVLDSLQGYREIRFFRQHEKILAHVGSAFSDYAEANFRFVRTMGITESLLETTAVLIIFLPVVVGGYAMIIGVGGISVGLIIAFQVYLVLLADGINKISIGLAESIKITPAVERLLEIRDYALEEQSGPVDWSDIPDSTAIEFKQVSFSYLKETQLITDLNLRIDPAEKICIMGQSGSGKTTIANLLLRFLVPDAGKITLGNSNIQEYPLDLYFSRFSYVRQDTYLFRMSVKENIMLGKDDVPDEAVQEVVAQVGLKEAVESLPEKYDTIVGQNGVDFSGGQKQRLSLARALIRGPKILILDEFTSALDSGLEQKILDDIFALFKHQTIICITHSEDVAKRFDRVIRLESPATRARIHNSE